MGIVVTCHICTGLLCLKICREHPWMKGVVKSLGIVTEISRSYFIGNQVGSYELSSWQVTMVIVG